MLSPIYCRPIAYERFRMELGCIDTTPGLFRAAFAISLHERPEANLAEAETTISRLVTTVRTRVRSVSLSITHNSVPAVTDSKLSNIVKDLYKGAKGPNPIGTGSTADAVRNELITGLPTHGRFHTQKAQEYSNALRNWLKNNRMRPRETD